MRRTKQLTVGSGTVKSRLYISPPQKQAHIRFILNEPLPDMSCYDCDSSFLDYSSLGKPAMRLGKIITAKPVTTVANIGIQVQMMR